MLLLLLAAGGFILHAINTDEETQGPVPTTAAIGNFTRPGTQLKFGEKALVPAKTKGLQGILGVTATGIKKGDPADLAPLKLGDTAAGKTPYYVSFVVTNESGTDLAHVIGGATGGLLGDGKRAESLRVSNFAPCRTGFATKNFTTKGASFTTCALTLAGGNAAVVAASYAPVDGDINYTTNPIIWR